MSIVVAAILISLFSMVVLLFKGIAGPTVFDRILIANAFGTKIVVAIVLIGELLDNMMFLDVALVYALVNFTATIALLRYFKYGSFGQHGSDLSGRL